MRHDVAHLAASPTILHFPSWAMHARSSLMLPWTANSSSILKPLFIKRNCFDPQLRTCLLILERGEGREKEREASM